MKKTFFFLAVIGAFLFMLVGGYVFSWPYMWPIINLSIQSKFEEFETHDSLFLKPESLSIAFDAEAIKYTEQQFYEGEELNKKGTSLSFKSPWKLIQIKKVTDAIYSYEFEGNREIFVNYSESSPLNDLKTDHSVEVVKLLTHMRPLLGEDAFSSDYFFTEEALNATPNDFNIFNNPLDNEVRWVLLMNKLALAGNSDNIYKLNTVRGFQFYEDERTRVLIFPNEKSRVLISFKNENIIQDEINFVLSTIKLDLSQTEAPQ